MVTIRSASCLLLSTCICWLFGLTGCSDPEGELVAEYDLVDLGEVAAGDVLEGAVSFSNLGEGAVEVLPAEWAFDADGAFEFREFQGPESRTTIGVNETLALGVRFEANEPGVYWGSVEVAYLPVVGGDEQRSVDAAVRATSTLAYDDEDGDGYSVADGDCDGVIVDDEDLDADGFTPCDGDCDDGDELVHPDADEVCNGIDDDCDGEVVDEDDLDGDGYLACDGDCDDADATIHPDAEDPCNGEDDACDGLGEAESDADGDGVMACDGDCDDADADVYPGGAEVCDGADNDCDGALMPGELDLDGDGSYACGGDCDDSDPDRYGGAPELCDGLDNDCDGVPGAGETDADGDGWMVCEGDCDDADADVHPGGGEACNGLDDNCDGTVPANEADADGDGHRVCEADCDDTDPAIHPGAAELCDGLDNDCDGNAGAEEQDNDGDGYSVCDGDCQDGRADMHPGAVEICDGDCDDSSGAVHPGAVEFCNGADDDCDGSPMADELDLDGDGYLACAGDCDDMDPAVHPGAIEFCNGIDDDCAGGIPSDEADIDGDGWMACDGDCRDNMASVHPAASEACDTLDADCDGELTDGCVSCLEALQYGLATVDGQYALDPDGPGGDAQLVLECDMSTDGGGWTLVQRTGGDWTLGEELLTDYATFHGTTSGDLAGAYRLAGARWPDLVAAGEMLLVVLPREDSLGACSDSLYYDVHGLTLDTPAGGPATASGYFQVAEVLGADEFSTLDSGPATACVNDHQVVPWFLDGCSETLPTWDGDGAWSEPAPAIEYGDSRPDMFGNTTDDVCASVDRVDDHEAAVSMSVYLR